MVENLRYKPLHTRCDERLAAVGSDEQCWVLMRSLQSKVSVSVPDSADGKTRVERRYGYENAQGLFCEFFMPMKEHVACVRGRREIRRDPAVAGMFFVRDTIPYIRRQASLGLGFELKYLKGRKYMEPVVLPDAEMRNFISALSADAEVRLYAPDDDALRGKVGRRVRVTQGDHSFEGHIISLRGSAKRRLRLSLENCLVAEMEINLNDQEVVELLD